MNLASASMCYVLKLDSTFIFSASSIVVYSSCCMFMDLFYSLIVEIGNMILEISFISSYLPLLLLIG